MVFDLEFGQPAASSSLPNVKTQSNFKDILGCYGHASCGRTLAEGGLDILLCSHQVQIVIIELNCRSSPGVSLMVHKLIHLHLVLALEAVIWQ